jgi:hypothetical protein
MCMQPCRPVDWCLKVSPRKEQTTPRPAMADPPSQVRKSYLGSEYLVVDGNIFNQTCFQVICYQDCPPYYSFLFSVTNEATLNGHALGTTSFSRHWITCQLLVWGRSVPRVCQIAAEPRDVTGLHQCLECHHHLRGGRQAREARKPLLQISKVESQEGFRLLPLCKYLGLSLASEQCHCLWSTALGRDTKGPRHCQNTNRGPMARPPTR